MDFRALWGQKFQKPPNQTIRHPGNRKMGSLGASEAKNTAIQSTFRGARGPPKTPHISPKMAYSSLKMAQNGLKTSGFSLFRTENPNLDRPEAIWDPCTHHTWILSEKCSEFFSPLLSAPPPLIGHRRPSLRHFYNGVKKLARFEFDQLFTYFINVCV